METQRVLTAWAITEDGPHLVAADTAEDGEAAEDFTSLIETRLQRLYDRHTRFIIVDIDINTAAITDRIPKALTIKEVG